MKRYIVCFLMFMCICLITEKAYALSVQARYVVGGIGIEQNNFNTSGMGLDVFVYEGGNLDIFIGAEQNSFSVSEFGYDHKFGYSAKATAFDVGFRFKPTTTWRIKPYFPVELLYLQNIEYEVKSTSPDVTLSYNQPGSKIGGRLGVGTDIGLSDRLTLGVQLYVTALPPPKVMVHDPTGQGDYTKEPMNSFASINLGLRYSF